MSDLGNKEIFSKNLNYYLSINNKDRNDLVKDLDFPYSTITDWINGNSYPNIGRIEILANYFNIEKSDLIENKRLKKNKVAVLGSIPAGIPLELIEDIIDYEEISEEMLKGGKEYFALKIDEENGHSMEPEYKPGDVLIVLKQDTCENGDDCIIAVNGNDATFKRVLKNENGIILQPLNSNYPPIIYSNDDIISKPVKILGVVVEFRRTKRKI